MSVILSGSQSTISLLHILIDTRVRLLLRRWINDMKRNSLTKKEYNLFVFDNPMSMHDNIFASNDSLIFLTIELLCQTDGLLFLSLRSTTYDSNHLMFNKGLVIRTTSHPLSISWERRYSVLRHLGYRRILSKIRIKYGLRYSLCIQYSLD